MPETVVNDVCACVCVCSYACACTDFDGRTYERPISSFWFFDVARCVPFRLPAVYIATSIQLKTIQFGPFMLLAKIKLTFFNLNKDTLQREKAHHFHLDDFIFIAVIVSIVAPLKMNETPFFRRRNA